MWIPLPEGVMAAVMNSLRPIANTDELVGASVFLSDDHDPLWFTVHREVVVISDVGTLIDVEEL